MSALEAPVIARSGGLFPEALHWPASSQEVDLIEASMLDSLKVAELPVQLEEQFSTRVSSEHLGIDNCRRIRRMAAFVVDRNGSKRS